MRFSIITVCKDNLNELILTFASINSQNNADYEWIVIDGSSKDGTKKWLEANSLSMNWVSEPDKGIYDAMNKGVRLAQGDFLVFMNSGDEFFNTNVLEKIESSIKKSGKEPDLIFGDSIDVDEKGNEYYRKAKKVARIKYGMITQHQAMFFNRSNINNTPYSAEYKLSSDYALIAETIRKSQPETIIQEDFPICKFKMGGTNEILRFKAIKEDYLIRKKILALSELESLILYFLHFNHAVIKQLFKKARFIKHKKSDR